MTRFEVKGGNQGSSVNCGFKLWSLSIFSMIIKGWSKEDTNTKRQRRMLYTKPLFLLSLVKMINRGGMTSMGDATQTSCKPWQSYCRWISFKRTVADAHDSNIVTLSPRFTLKLGTIKCGVHGPQFHSYIAQYSPGKRKPNSEFTATQQKNKTNRNQIKVKLQVSSSYSPFYRLYVFPN